MRWLVVLFFAASAVLTGGFNGCLEASFELSPDSRLPKWFSVPEGMARKDLAVTMDYYSTFNSGKSVFILYKKGSFLRTDKVTGQPVFPYIRELKSPPAGFSKGFPNYAVITVDGVTDIVEHRGMEPVFYMTDDPAVWRELGVEQK